MSSPWPIAAGKAVGKGIIWQNLPESRSKSAAKAAAARREAAITEQMQLDVFRNDPIYQAAFEHGDFGDINDATLEDFGKAGTFIADSIFATDNSDAERRASQAADSGDTGSGATGYPSYVDVSAYYEEYTQPAMYAEPADIEMPEILKQYNTNVAELPAMTEPGSDAYPGDPSNFDTYQQEMDQPTHQKTWRTVRTAADFNTDEQSSKFAKKALDQIGMKDNDKGYQVLDRWMQISGTKNLKSKNDLKRFKEATRKYGGNLPEIPPQDMNIFK